MRVLAIYKSNKVVKEGAGADSKTAGPAKTHLFKGGTYTTLTPSEEAEEVEEPAVAGGENAPAAPPQETRHGAHPQTAPQARPEEPMVEEIIEEPLPPPPPPPPQIDKEIIEEAEKNAEEIIKKARAEAKKLIEETKLYSQSAFSQAERDGMVQGKEKGFEAGREEMANLIKEAKNVLEQSKRERELVIRSIEPEIAKLSIRIAEKIIQTQVEINQDIVINMIRAALDKVKQRDEVVIKVNQEDYDYVREKKDVFACMVEGLKSMEILVDPGVERGGCIIETNLGNVDARISTQIQTVQLAFEKVTKEAEGNAEPGGVQD